MSAFRATYSDMKLIKTRQVVQIIFEVAQKDFDAAYDVLGGLPNPSSERWFGIAALKPEMEVMPHPVHTVQGRDNAEPQPAYNKPRPAGAKRDWRDIPPSQQAGMRCEEPTFAAFLKEQRADDWHEAQDAAECVRLICGVGSRAELGSNQKARVIWTQLNSQYEAWKAMEHA